MDDATLLDRYVRTGDERAFADLVGRHLNFVYAAALRQVGGDAHFAEDVAQVVFTDLARKAATLRTHPVLKGWLFTSARFAAAKIVRSERIRRTRQLEAAAMKQNEESVAWETVRPVLDEALADLKAGDRNAVLLRFFESASYAKVGMNLKISEDAARMRVERALDQLRSRLARLGITSTPAALGAMLTSQAAVEAPARLLEPVIHDALAKAAVPGPGALQIIMGTKTTVGAVAVLSFAALSIIPSIGIAVYQTRAARQAEQQAVAAERSQQMQAERLKRLKVEARQDASQNAQNQRLAGSAQIAAKAVANSGAATSQAPTDPRGDGAQFLAAYPQIRPLLLESGKMRTDPKLLDILRRTGMSEEQIDAFNTRMWTARIESLKATPDIGLGWTVSGLPSPDELRPLIGDAGMNAITAWTKMAMVNEAAASVAAGVAFTGTPLTPGQIDELAHAMATVKPSAALAPGSSDWNMAFGALQSQITPAQWEQVENGVARVGFPRLLGWLQQQATNAVAGDQSKTGAPR